VTFIADWPITRSEVTVTSSTVEPVRGARQQRSRPRSRPADPPTARQATLLGARLGASRTRRLADTILGIERCRGSAPWSTCSVDPPLNQPNPAGVLQQGHTRQRGHWYEDFEIGREFTHHWGRTINEGDNSLFTTLTLHFNPLYFNKEFAVAHGHPREQVNPMLVFTTVFGMSVEDLSENGAAFLGVSDVTYLAFNLSHPPFDDVRVRRAISHALNKDPKQAICTWHTKGFNQKEQMVIDFKRTNLILRKPSE
jgi:acyl dehydratase